jgi:hypothetical protein
MHLPATLKSAFNNLSVLQDEATDSDAALIALYPRIAE